MQFGKSFIAGEKFYDTTPAGLPNWWRIDGRAIPFKSDDCDGQLSSAVYLPRLLAAISPQSQPMVGYGFVTSVSPSNVPNSQEPDSW